MNFTERRKQVFDKMDQDSALLLFSGIELHVSADEYLPFEANRNFFYLTGLRRDHMILMMKKTAKEEKSILFIEEADLNQENLEALEKGLPNLLHHVDTIRNTFHLPCVVAVNAFPTDTEAELRLVEDKCRELGVRAVLSEVWAKGGEGGKALAEEVIRLAEDTTNDHFQFVYDLEDSIEEKLNKIATKVYRADGVVLAGDAKKQAAQLTELGFDKMPICMAKTQFSFSDDQTKLGAPRGFKITVREIKVNAGAGFLVAKTGNIMTMPGLPKVPASERIDIDANGKITGLF